MELWTEETDLVVPSIVDHHEEGAVWYEIMLGGSVVDVVFAV